MDVHVHSLGEPLEHQFEPDGDGFLYRRYPGDPAVRVTAAEHEAYIEEMRRWTGRVIVTLFVVLIAGAVAAIALGSPDDLVSRVRIGLSAMIIAMGVWASYRVIHAPSGAARPPEPGTLRFADEMRYNRLARLSYARLALAVPIAVIVVASMSRGADMLHGWDRLTLVAGAAILCPAAIQLFRKWREEPAG